jgi:hypothetical protein
MLTTIDDPNFKLEADQAIKEFCKEVNELTYVEHGADNIIALVNKEYVFRFPRNENAAKRLAYETALLQKVYGHIQTIQIPQVVKVHNRPLYTVASYIHGDHLSGQEIQQLAEEEQAEIGRAIADFVFQLNQSISSLEVRRLRMQAYVDDLVEPWPLYFDRILRQERLPNELLRPIIEQYYPLWHDYVLHEQSTNTIHDDLNSNNLLFVGPRLNGVVDFSDVNTGSIESEFRKLFVMGDGVLRSAISRYEALSQTKVDYDHIRIWAIMQELARFTSRLARQDTDNFLFQYARENLRKWVPGFSL